MVLRFNVCVVLSSCAGRRTLRSSVRGNLVIPFARSAAMQTRSFSVEVQQRGMDFNRSKAPPKRYLLSRDLEGALYKF